MFVGVNPITPFTPPHFTADQIKCQEKMEFCYAFYNFRWDKYS